MVEANNDLMYSNPQRDVKRCGGNPDKISGSASVCLSILRSCGVSLRRRLRSRGFLVSEDDIGVV